MLSARARRPGRLSGLRQQHDHNGLLMYPFHLGCSAQLTRTGATSLSGVNGMSCQRQLALQANCDASISASSSQKSKQGTSALIRASNGTVLKRAGQNGPFQVRPVYA